MKPQAFIGSAGERIKAAGLYSEPLNKEAILYPVFLFRC